MHPGDDTAVAARFLGWLQGRGEDTGHLARDQARIGELLAWDIDDFGLEHLDLEDEERPRVVGLIALWREFREAMPAPSPLNARGSSWLVPLQAESVAPTSVVPALATPRSWLPRLRLRTREWMILGLLIGASAWISREGRPEPGASAISPGVHPAPGLRSDLELRRAMAAALACRGDAARRLVATRAEVVAGLSPPDCLEDGPCRDRRDAAERDLASAQAFEDATRSLAARVAPLPRARCEHPEVSAP